MGAWPRTVTSSPRHEAGSQLIARLLEVSYIKHNIKCDNDKCKMFKITKLKPKIAKFKIFKKNVLV